MRLNIGAGNVKMDGFASVDKYADADYKANIVSLPFPNNSISEIYTSHTLEHLGKYEVPKALKEIYRVLEFKGTYTIIVPDLEWCVNEYLKSSNKYGFVLDTIYGNQEHEGEFHKTGFTLEILKKLVIDTGFKITKAEYITDHAVKSIKIQGWKE